MRGASPDRTPTTDDPTGSEARSGVRSTQTLDRGLDLLERIAREPMALRDLADRSGLALRTTTRLVNGLVGRDFLTVAADGRLRVGKRLTALAATARNRTSLLELAREPLRALARRTGLSSFLGRRDGDHSVHLHRTAGNRRVLVATPVGTRRRLAETSLGKALLLDDDAAAWRRLFDTADPIYRPGDWEEQMRRGVADGMVVHHGPPPDSIRAVAAPVRDAAGRIVCAISVAGTAQCIDPAGLDVIAPDVRETARTISLALGWEEPAAPRRAPAPGSE